VRALTLEKWSSLAVSAALAAFAVNELISFNYWLQPLASMLAFYASYLWYESFKARVEVERLEKEIVKMKKESEK